MSIINRILSRKSYSLSKEYENAQKILSEAKSIVDLGCGSNPHPRACVAVDKYKDWEEPWFGEGPVQINGKIKAQKNCNPFDILLNEGNWYHGIHRYKKLTNYLQKYWYGHSKSIETCFVWKDSFDFLIVYKDESFKTSKIS